MEIPDAESIMAAVAKWDWRIYVGARDQDQARIIHDVMARMVRGNPAGVC